MKFELPEKYKERLERRNSIRIKLLGFIVPAIIVLLIIARLLSH